MKILHTSDWHLGINDNERSLIEDQRFFINEICNIVEKENADVVMIAGDVYDRSIASAEALKLYDEVTTRLCLSMNRKVIVIAGNHDSAERIAGSRELLEKSGLYILGVLERKPHIVSIGDTDFYLLPWFTEERVKSLYPERKEDIKSLTDAYRIVCDECRSTFVTGRRHIAVSHAFVTNAVTSGSDRSAEIAAVGTALHVDADVFEGFDYVALGHIHGAQDISDNIRYSGTPMPYSFGREEKHEKSVTLIDTETMERKVIGLPLLHQRNTIEGTFEEIARGNYADDIKNGYVRLKVTDSFVGLEGISKLKAVYPNVLEIIGKTFESEDAGIRMTMEEFEELEQDPMAIFVSYCRDTINEDPDEHIKLLFSESIKEVMER